MKLHTTRNNNQFGPKALNLRTFPSPPSPVSILNFNLHPAPESDRGHAYFLQGDSVA